MLHNDGQKLTRLVSPVAFPFQSVTTNYFMVVQYFLGLHEILSESSPLHGFVLLSFLNCMLIQRTNSWHRSWRYCGIVYFLFVLKWREFRMEHIINHFCLSNSQSNAKVAILPPFYIFWSIKIRILRAFQTKCSRGSFSQLHNLLVVVPA